MSLPSLKHPLLSERGIDHGLAVFGVLPFPGAACPEQVHGVDVALCNTQGELRPSQADAVMCDEPGVHVGIVTADCVPVLAARNEGKSVVAIHAGWRGLASGVVERGVGALLDGASLDEDRVAVIGPHIGACCYEVDAPVIEALSQRYSHGVEGSTRPSRPGHFWLDLGKLVTEVLEASGFQSTQIGRFPDSCTFCCAQKYPSFRREGSRAGRMLHHISACDLA